MRSLEDALKRLAARLTGRAETEMPQNLEGIVDYTADHLAEAAGVPGPQGEKGDPGADGAPGTPGDAGADGIGITDIALIKNDQGELTGGTWTDTAGETHDIIIKGDDE